MSTLVGSPAQSGYKVLFLVSLIVATLLPTVVSLLNYEVLGQNAYALTYLFSLLTIMGGAHVWLTIAYYFDRRWLMHFRSQPFVFFAAPAAILVASSLLVAQPNKAIGLVLVNGAIFVNLWHHAKQNWGILAMVGKIRKTDVTAWRLPLIYAWPFFIIPTALQLAETRELFDRDWFLLAAQVSSLLYVVFSIACIVRNGWGKSGDLVSLTFAFALCAYFLPMVFLYGKPYSLAIWAFAHGLQYYLFVLVSLAFRERTKTTPRQLFKLIATVAGVLVVLSFVAYGSTRTLTSGGDIWNGYGVRLLLGFVTGVNFVHFWLDAFIWRFSLPEVRSIHGEAFQF